MPFNKILLIASRVGGCIEKLLIATVLIYGDEERETDEKRKENTVRRQIESRIQERKRGRHKECFRWKTV